VGAAATGRSRAGTFWRGASRAGRVPERQLVRRAARNRGMAKGSSRRRVRTAAWDTGAEFRPPRASDGLRSEASDGLLREARGHIWTHPGRKSWGEPLGWHKLFGHSFRFRKSVLASPSRRRGLGKGTAFESPLGWICPLIGTHACIRPLTTEEWVTPQAQMGSALLLLIRSSACWSQPIAPSSAAPASLQESLSLEESFSGLHSMLRADTISPGAISDHTIRAFLLAGAMQGFDVPNRRCLSVIQRLAPVGLPTARLTTERAPPTVDQ
jgi:hypothetical protein